MSHLIHRVAGTGIAITTAIAAALAAPAFAQDTSATPNYGDVSVNTGFTPDPLVVDVQAGGSLDASNAAESCRGKISNSPDYRVRYTAGSLPLIFRTRAATDTTLVVNGPDGRWYCDDDSGGNMNAQVVFNNPRSGSYEVWVGTYAGGVEPARLEVSELVNGGGDGEGDGGGGNNPGVEMPDTSLQANYGSVTLTRAFRPDPRIIRVQAGGTLEASNISDNCRGRISRAPDYQVTYNNAGNLPLYFRTQSNADTTLVINDANGNWVCDDDSGGGNNAEIMFNRPATGVYDVWVGSYNGETAPASLIISERRR